MLIEFGPDNPGSLLHFCAAWVGLCPCNIESGGNPEGPRSRIVPGTSRGRTHSNPRRMACIAASNLFPQPSLRCALDTYLFTENFDKPISADTRDAS